MKAGGERILFFLQSHESRTLGAYAAHDRCGDGESSTATAATAFMVNFDFIGGEGSSVRPNPIESNCAWGGWGDAGGTSVTIISVLKDGTEELIIGIVVGTGEHGDEGWGLGDGFADFEGEAGTGAKGCDGEAGIARRGEYG